MLRSPIISPELFAVLKATSRSFYLSLRFLPVRIRATLSLAYLLARATDTIADTNKLAPADRRTALAEFEGAIGSGAGKLDLDALISSQPLGAERSLLTQVPALLQTLSQLPAGHRILVIEVLQKIIRGQTLDLDRFELRRGVQALSDRNLLDEYTYLVAGSVGEFWTHLCHLEWSKYSKIPEGELIRLGTNFGKGLQLINIVRDFPSDLRLGRSYLPVADPEAVAGDPDLARPEWEQACGEAFRYLNDGWHYVCAIRPFRVRFACTLPLFIGFRTLNLLGREPRITTGIKVSRPEVYRLILLAALVAGLPFLQARIYKAVTTSSK